MNYYAGIDVSLRSVNICVIDDQGEFVAETKLDSEVTDIVDYLDGLDLDISSIGFEAGTARCMSKAWPATGSAHCCPVVKRY